MKKEATKARVLKGIIVSDKMDKTIVVAVTRFTKDPKYGKYRKIVKKYHAHDENNSHKEGETVTIRETRPLSKTKSFIVVDTK